MSAIHIDPKKRLFDKVKVGNQDECWPYIGAISTDGYGMFYLNRQNIHASRAAWLLVNGEIPSGQMVCHKCDNRPCCNPNHLFLGTSTDNVRDMMNKGRKVTLRGEDDPKSILTEGQVIEIRRMYQPRKFSQQKIANLFGVNRTTIQAIIERRNWAHVE